nr:hypothetical protein [Candidatus Sigynarchaeota archaeon]
MEPKESIKHAKDEEGKKKNKFSLAYCVANKFLEDKFLGRVISDVKSPTTSQLFNVGFDTNARMELGEVVAIFDERYESVIYGIVEEIFMFEDVPDYPQKMMECNWDFTNDKPIKRSLLGYAQVKLLRRFSENPRHDLALYGIMPNLPAHRVGSEGLLQAFDLGKEGIPVGVYALSSGQTVDDAVIRIDVPYLLGKEAAHVNISGQSGFGKTAYALYMLKAIFQTVPDSVKVKVVVFNVKQDDLLWLDQANDELDDVDKKLYEMLGVDPTPFDNVAFYGTERFIPETSKYVTASFRPDVETFFWDWSEVQSHIQYAIGPQEDFDDKMLQALNIIQEARLSSFTKAMDKAREYEEQGKAAGTPVHSYSWGKFLRILNGIYLANKGLLRQSKPIPYEKVFKNNDILVVDINEAFFPEYTQRLVLGKIVSDVQLLHQQKKIDADFLIFVTDELSRYASKSADEHLRKVKEIIKGIAARGRSIQTPLIGLEQFPSEIDDQILGNINTKVFSRTKQSELKNQLYKVYSDRVRFEMVNLKKGFVFVENSQFPDLIKVKYPRPPCAQKRPAYFQPRIVAGATSSGARDDDEAGRDMRDVDEQMNDLLG